MKDWLLEHKLATILTIVAIIIFGGGYYLYDDNSQATNLSMPSNSGLEQKQEEDSTPKNEQNKSEQPEQLMVDVKGQVKKPGVYAAVQGERVMDVINRAGGITDKADETQVNFAEHVQDEMVIYIPVKGEAGHVAQGNVTAHGDTSSTKVNINEANAVELQTLPGIGQAKAAAIIEYRETSGPFKTCEDLKNISGIGEKTFEKLKDLVDVQ